MGKVVLYEYRFHLHFTVATFGPCQGGLSLGLQNAYKYKRS